jgi:mannose-6-phosphate isomerase-like protein (cupin superfamily)
MRKRTFTSLVVGVLLAASCVLGADPVFLRRQIADVKPQADDLSAGAKGAAYRPIFGVGDQDVALLKAVARVGELTLAPGGASAIVSYPAEEQMYFISEGAGTLLYDNEKAPVKTNDFMYLPVGVKHGIANTSSAPLRVLVFGYKISAGRTVNPTPKLMLATADDVNLQVLGSHGPTTQFKLLMGLTSSQRDKLASAYEMNSMFIMDFAPSGTNIPHNHASEEEYYILLRGSGDMVAGRDAEGKDIRHPVKEGAVFFFFPGTQVGYYSNAKEGQPHDIILALRSRLPGGGRRGPQ